MHPRKQSTLETLENDVKYFKLTIKKPEKRHLHRSSVFIIKFEPILKHVNFNQVNVFWDVRCFQENKVQENTSPIV